MNHLDQTAEDMLDAVEAHVRASDKGTGVFAGSVHAGFPDVPWSIVSRAVQLLLVRQRLRLNDYMKLAGNDEERTDT